MHRLKPESQYYLQVVKANQEPKFPVPEENLIVGSQSLGDDYVQYWAYSKESGFKKTDIPLAERIAAKNKTTVPAVLIDQSGNEATVTLILTKDGHAWAKTESSIDNLEENINAIVELGEKEFGFKLEHFMTTSTVSEEVEKKLDALEDKEKNQSPIALQVEEVEEGLQEQESEATSEPADEETDEQGPPVEQKRPINSGIYIANKPSTASFSQSKFVTIILIIVLLGLVGGAFYFRSQILGFVSGKGLTNILGGEKQEVTPTPEPTNTPTPTPEQEKVDRSKYSVRVLNGTTKAGAAGRLSDTLEALGWQIESVGNATDSNTEQTTVRAKEGMEDVLNIFIADISEEYDATTSSQLEETDDADLEIVIGNK